MASNTPNYNLKKPAATDFYHVEDQNTNMDKLDAALKGLADGKAPATHAAQHAAGGSDPVTPESIGAAEVGHTHTPAGIGAAPAVHTHDDRYFTEAESLSAATAALYGLGNGAVPNDVLTWLGQYNKYWWKRRLTGLQWFAVQTLYTGTGAQAARSGARIISYSASYTINSSGVIVLTSPETLSVPATYSGATTLTQLNGKYCQNFYTQSTSTWYVPSGTNLYMGGMGDDDYVYIDIPQNKCYTLSTYQQNVVGEWEHLQSTNANAYPAGGISGGYEYQYLGVPFKNSITAPNIATGSYTGTGTYGSANKNTLTFEFTPRVVFISIIDSYTGGTLALIRGNNVGTNIGASNYLLYLTWGSNSLSWYCQSNAAGQMNESGIKYGYAVIG